MSTPVVVALCRCGHAESRHRDEEGCGNQECGCAEFRAGASAPAASQPARVPIAAAALPRRPVVPIPAPAAGPSAEQVIAAAKRSASKRTQHLAERVEGGLAELRSVLSAERQAAEAKRRSEAAKEAARSEIQRLERELATARAKLHPASRAPRSETAPGQPRAEKPGSVGDIACSRPGCDRSFATSQARAMHERRAHDGFDPRAAKAG